MLHMALALTQLLLAINTPQALDRPSSFIRDQLDTLQYNGYTIIKTSDAIDSTVSIYSVIIKKNGRIVWRLGSGAEERQYNIAGLISFLGDTTSQLLVQQFTGGAHCCWNIWLLGLGDVIDTLFCSDAYDELGGEPDFIDYDKDGVREIAVGMFGFKYFDMLSYAASPYPMAYFKYSKKARRFDVASRLFADLILDHVDSRINELKRFAEIADTSKDYDDAIELKSAAFSLLLDFVYAGQRDEGWRLYEKYYVLPDKAVFRGAVQAALEESRVYRELYAGGGGN